eukprot:gene14325-30497_t
MSKRKLPDETKELRKSTRVKKTVEFMGMGDDQELKVDLKLTIGRLPSISIYSQKQKNPEKNKKGDIIFTDYPNFRPNLTPKEVIQAGSFGGTYFRPIYSSVTQERYSSVWKEFPSDWFDGITISQLVTCSKYNEKINTYKVSCGQGLDEWEKSGWITDADPYGWFQWYCRFYLGRRCSDDERQLSRAMGVMGPTGRWRNNLINKCKNSGLPPVESVHDFSIAPKVRQLLQ